MPDYIEIKDAGGVTRKVSVDEVSSQFVQRFKMQFGADNSAADVSSANPLPVGDAAALEALEAIVAALALTIKVGDGSGALTVDGAVGVSSLPALAAGAATIGKLGANSGVDIGDVDVTSISAGSNLIGDVGLRPRTEGGLSIHKNLDVDESEDAVKGTKGQIYFVRYENRSSSERFLKFYNDTVANVVVGTTAPLMTWSMEGKEKGLVSIPQGLAFSAAITIAATTGIADNDTGAPSVNDVLVTVGYA